MGHWSHTCQLSNIPITGGTKVLLYLLKMKDHWYDYSEDDLRKYGTSYMCSNDGTTTRFVPFAFPIRGEYDEYGGIENIERDENVEFLEEYFGLDIDTMMKVVNSNRKDDGYDDNLNIIKDLEESVKMKPVYKEEFKELLSISGMWVHQEFHDNLVKAYKIDDYDDRVELGTPALLNSLGFEFVGKDETKERFNQKFQKGTSTVYSDGNWLEGSIYTFKSLKKHCKLQGEHLDISEVLTKNRIEQIYDYLLPEVREKVIESESVNPVDNFGRWYSLKNDRMIAEVCKIFDRNGRWDSTTELGKKYVMAAVDGKFRRHASDAYIFDKAMYVCGKYYDLTGVSPQDGDHNGVHWVTKTAMDTLTPIVEEWNDENYWEEE